MFLFGEFLSTEEIAPIESTNPDVFMTLGWIMLQKDSTSQAIEYFHQAVDISFDDREEILLEISSYVSPYMYNCMVKMPES